MYLNFCGNSKDTSDKMFVENISKFWLRYQLECSFLTLMFGMCPGISVVSVMNKGEDFT
jgi:hypothetical protein